MSVKLEAQPLDLALPELTLGEGPFWDNRKQVLYYVDIIGQCIHRYDPMTGVHETCRTSSMVSFVIPEEAADKLTIGLQDGIYRLNFDTGEYQPLAKPAMRRDNRFNDAKPDPTGKRLWAGTMNLKPDTHTTGALYRIDENGLAEIKQDIGISNGIGWSPDGKTMYHTDTLRRHAIYIYDYDPQTGTATNGRPFIKNESNRGHHDGLAVDREGRVFTAKWGGSVIEIYTPDGILNGAISVPAPHVSSCVFGGADLKTLYITTARDGLSDADLERAPLSGHIFTVKFDVPGIAIPAYRHYS
jgi:xylono-1,5-lactonase